MILSLATMLFTFIILYIPLTYFLLPTSYYDNHFFVFVFLLMIMHPIHKLLHYLPLAHLGLKVRKKVEWKLLFYPIIEIKVTEPISKKLFLVSLFMPVIIVSSVFIIACFLFPNYVHYLTMLMAFHIGLSVPDFIFGKSILTAPKCSYIEENEDGFEILIYKP